MKLVTFQSMEALKSLINNGVLMCNDKYINKKKSEPTYLWITEKMNERIENKNNYKYPIWCWVKCYNAICPPKHKGDPVEGFDVKITFRKDKKDVFITDFRRYSFLLKNNYIPENINDKNKFDNLLKEKNITLEELHAYVRPDKYESHRKDKDYIDVCNKIRESFDRCITENSDVLQGCVWSISLDEIEKIEILKKDGYRYGSLNYIRANGKRIDWQEDLYKLLK